MMHGHTRRVKSGPMAAIYAARECGADILLFGHTHQRWWTAAAILVITDCPSMMYTTYV